MALSLNDLMYAYYASIVDGSAVVSGGIPSTIPVVQQSTSLSDTNVLNAPAANAVLATVTITSAGTYAVEVVSAIGGTTAATVEMNNMRLRLNTVAVGRIINPVPGTSGATATGNKRARIVAAQGDTINVIAVVAATAGSVYGCDLVASRIA